jgi:hypothetical protein
MNKLTECFICHKPIYRKSYLFKKSKLFICGKYDGENRGCKKVYARFIYERNLIKFIGQQNKGKPHSKEWKMKISETVRKTKSTKEYMEKTKGIYKKSPEQIEKIRQSNIRTWDNPMLRKNLSEKRKAQGNFRLGAKHTTTTKMKMGISAKKRWLNPEYIRHLKVGMNIKPTKPENFLINFLNIHFPNEWKYVGDWSFG